MKCCSFQKTDLEKHYAGMSSRFYAISGLDDANLKQAYLNSLPEPLGNETAKMLTTKNLTMATASLGEIYQNSLLALEKFCNTSKFLKQLDTLGKRLGTACTNHLSIKCKDEKTCDCRTTKKSHFKKFRPSQPPVPKWQFLRKKKFKGRTIDTYYICKKKGHFAKNCPRKEKSIHLLQQARQLTDSELSDVESHFSIEESYSPDSLLAIPVYSSEEEEDFPHQNQAELLAPSHLFQPSPTAQISIKPEPFARPTPVIAYFDTGAAAALINPTLLPDTHWKSTNLTFRAVNGELFQITKISKPITIQLFPNMRINHQVLGCKLTGKDLLLGFDILHQLPALRWSKHGLTSPPHFLPWTHIPKLYHLSYDPAVQMLQSSCATSHSTFSHKYPLWKNEQIFVHLPFKLNEDVKPTTASHRGMAPELYQQATKELAQLQTEGIIEPTSSPWACEAFYVNKRVEQTRGKLRLVVNYQPLNHFLADSKFPLPQKSDMFQHIKEAKIFSKFDLK